MNRNDVDRPLPTEIAEAVRWHIQHVETPAELAKRIDSAIITAEDVCAAAVPLPITRRQRPVWFEWAMARWEIAPDGQGWALMNDLEAGLLRVEQLYPLHEQEARVRARSLRAVHIAEREAMKKRGRGESRKRSKKAKAK